ncbi:MAG: T9SS type A sorting domain-containing protein [Bacteroidota bacterium]|nr:T9SS type A sorting domain-containing protein [Bacteroidota bacterium]MDP4232153.1 T9SS type A sorting domain-containing protein [Bacteroidota bacterium]MDP4241139.1 T9SS type A sorting domain-containing protein [Bacteroidota bacterium]MDP4286531.1 T9SS type A sorting domain-containing protein [Bacteroidota bacterium]
MRTTLCLAIAIACSVSLRAQNCSHTSTGYYSITDLAKNHDEVAGLYPYGSNSGDGGVHDEEGFQRAATIVPLNTNGFVDSLHGKIVMIAFGMRERMAEASEFKHMIDTFAQKNTALQFIDCSQPGMDVEQFLTSGQAWNNILASLSTAGATPKQVQAMWFEDILLRQTDTLFYRYADTLKNYYVQVFQKLHQLFPNLKNCYLTSSAYAGYATTGVIREPYAYQTGWAVKWLIQEQINHDASLLFSITGGPMPQTENVPWLAWGPYFWADGTRTWMDTTLRWFCPTDFDTDGVTLAGAGKVKAAKMLFQFFTHDGSSVGWFTNTIIKYWNIVQLISPQVFDTIYSDTIHFKWNRVPGAIEYLLEYDGSGIYRGPDTAFDFRGYSPGPRYWGVVALDDSGRSIASTPSGLLEYFPLGYPISLVLPPNGATNVGEPVEREWDIITYHDYRYYADYATIFISTDSFELVTNCWYGEYGYDAYKSNQASGHLLPSTTYYWMARSYNYGAFTPVWRFTTSAADAPFNLYPRNGSDSIPTPIRLSWDIADQPKGGRAEIAKDPQLTQIVIIDSINGQYITLDTMTTYYWHVINTKTGETTDTEVFRTGHRHDTTQMFSSVDLKKEDPNIRTSSTSPNPFTRSTTLHFLVGQASFATLEVFDATGREVRHVNEGIMDAGEHDIEFDRHDLLAGVYFYRLITNDNEQAGTMVISN